MAEAALPKRKEPDIEILPPATTQGKETRICDCCRKRKCASQFDEDCCGICEECLFA